MYQVTNAIIMAAGTASRFAPLSYEKPKGLAVVKGEVLIERQIRQLKEAGIEQIILVVGYKKEEFYYLGNKYEVTISNTVSKFEIIGTRIFVKNKTYLNTFLKNEAERIFNERVKICYNFTLW